VCSAVTFFFLASQPPSFLACKPIADALADPRTDFGQLSGPENNDHNRQDNEKFPISDSEHNTSSLLSPEFCIKINKKFKFISMTACQTNLHHEPN
jgi:hypothetical protein